jgi:hypothetical protein
VAERRPSTSYPEQATMDDAAGPFDGFSFGDHPFGDPGSFDHGRSTPRTPSGDADADAPDLSPDDDWSTFFGDLDPDLIFECSATLAGEHNAVFVYHDRVVVEGPDVPGGSSAVSIEQIHGWALVVQGSNVVLTLQPGPRHRIQVPKAFRSVLRTALRKVLGGHETPPSDGVGA